MKRPFNIDNPARKWRFVEFDSRYLKLDRWFPGLDEYTIAHGLNKRPWGYMQGDFILTLPDGRMLAEISYKAENVSTEASFLGWAAERKKILGTMISLGHIQLSDGSFIDVSSSNIVELEEWQAARRKPKRARA